MEPYISLELTPEEEESDTELNTSQEAQVACGGVTLSTGDPISQQILTDTPQGSNTQEEVCEQSIQDTDANDANQALKQNQEFLRQNMRNIMRNRSRTKESSLLSIEEQLAAIGCKRKSIVADGNCFFRTVSHKIRDEEDQHPCIRSAITDYLQLCKAEFAPFVDRNEYPTPENYIERMKNNGTYADHLVVVATAVYFNKDIIIHEKGKMPLLCPRSGSRSDQQWHVLYDPDRQHYDSVISSGNNLPPFLSTEQVLMT